MKNEKVITKVLVFMLVVAVVFISSKSFAASNNQTKCGHKNVEQLVEVVKTEQYTEGSVTICKDCGEVVSYEVPKRTVEINSFSVKAKNVKCSDHFYCDVTDEDECFNFKYVATKKAEKKVETPKSKITLPKLHDKNYVVYISPSSQENNEYCMGNTTEEKEMNKVADKLIALLKKEYPNIKIYRNNKSNDHKGHAAQANSIQQDDPIDAYLAIHSNSSGSAGKARGPVQLVDGSDSKSVKFGHCIFDAISLIYPEGASNRSSNYTTSGGYTEIVKPIATSTLIEVAFHDNKDDTKWILENEDEIARALAKGLVDYLNTVK